MGYLLPVLSLLLLSAGVSHANLQAQLYWHTVLPNTAMPSAIRDLLHPDVSIDEKTGTSVNVGKGGVNVNTGYKKPGGGTNVNVGKGGVNFGTGHKGKPVIVNAGFFISPIIFNNYGAPPRPVAGFDISKKKNYNRATETQIHDDPRVTLFFLEKDLHSGAKMTLHFPSASNVATFLPRRAAENLPFSSEKAPEILLKFSLEPNSAEAEAMKKTIKECEEPAAEGEKKVCATSLESMVDFSTASLGTRDLVAASTTVGRGAEKEQEYTMGGVRKLAGSELVACHLEPYAYAVFYCHKTQKTTGYSVEMVGENGAKMEAVAVCHADTAAWNPGHVAFKVLKVKPGTVPVCHFVPQDHVVWVHSN